MGRAALMAGFGEIREWSSGGVDGAERALKKRSDQLLGLADELGNAANPSGWRGAAAEDAGARLHRLTDRIEHQVAEVHAVRAALITAADALTALRHEVSEVDSMARAHGMSIDARGAVVDPGPPVDVPAGQQAAVESDRARVRAELLDRVQHAVHRAEEIDEALAGVLSRAERSEISDGGATTLAAAAQAGATQGSLHDRLLARYNVSVDPDGMTTYPSGVGGWLAERLGIEPQAVTASEASHLDDIGLAGAVDAYGIYKTATHDAENVFGAHGREGLTDGHADAFRHAYWNAMLANRFDPEWTEGYTTAHERRPDNAATAEAMDLHNNEVGRRIAAEHPDASPDELKQHVEQAVRNGQMVVVGPDGRLVSSEQVGIGATGTATDPPAQGGQDPAQHDYGHSSGGYNYGRDGDSHGTYQN